MDKIRVLEIIQQGEIGGGESHLLTLLNNIDSSKFEPFVIALSDGEMIDRLNKMNIKNYVVESKLPFNLFTWKRMKQIVKENKIDIIHTHGARALSNIYYVAHQLAIPIVHTVHGWSFHDYLPTWKRKLRIIGERFLTQKASLNIAVSESNQKIGIDQLGSFNCKVVHNGVDLSNFSVVETDNTIRKEFSIPDNAILISFVARFIHDKNPLALIEAFAEVFKKHKNIYMLMVGDGPARQEAIQLAATLHCEYNIFFPGFRKDISKILQASDIFCLPSIKEGLPISLIEAMAMKNAVIATAVQGCVDVVDNDIDGLLVSMNQLNNQLAQAINRLVDDPILLERLAANARKTVEEKFEAKSMTRKIESIYADLLTSKKQ